MVKKSKKKRQKVIVEQPIINENFDKKFVYLCFITIFINFFVCGIVMMIYINYSEKRIKYNIEQQNIAISEIRTIVLDRHWIQFQSLNINQLKAWYEENQEQIKKQAIEKEVIKRVSKIKKSLHHTRNSKRKRTHRSIGQTSERNYKRH